MTDTLEWNPSIGFVYCDLIVVTGHSIHEQRKLVLNTSERLLNHGAASMFRKKYLEAIDGFDPDLRNCEDYDLIMRYQKKYSGYHLRLPYYRYFKEGSALSTKIVERKRIQKMLRERHKDK
jgi:hypothetical protein